MKVFWFFFSRKNIFLLFLLAACTPTPDECAFEKLETVPLRREGSFWAVAAQIDGQPATLMLDTGAGNAAALSPAAAARLGTRRTGLRFGISSGPGAGILAPVHEIGRLALGRVVLERVLVPELEAIPRLHGEFDGILGLEALEGFDLELDLPGGTLSFYRPRACPQGAPPWSGPVSGVRRLPAGEGAANRPFVPARLNGRPAHALLDTGATDTVVDSALARAAGAPTRAPRAAEVTTMVTITDPAVTIWRHGFEVLEVAGARIRAPRLWVAPLGEEPNLVVGQDILGGLRLWLSPGSGTVHIAPAAAPGG
jgi:predicted aspartyl protease